ncbi:MAG: helix-turn-helix transcriptional regulator [Patescibacteria group bacterium]
MKDFKIFKEQLLKNKETNKAYLKLKPQYDLIEMIIRERLKKGMTQEALAKKIGTKQSAIARFESGKTNPTISFLSNIAEALGGELTVSLK